MSGPTTELAVILDLGSRQMPSWAVIIEHWIEHGGDLPWLKARFIGWGEPFCFACGWLAPVTDNGVPRDEYVRRMWERAASWLDRAHLHDRCLGGPDTPHNIAPLCHLCHDEMTRLVDSPSTEYGLEWVATHKNCDPIWQLYTDEFLTGKRASRSTTYRARARFAELMLEAERKRPRAVPSGGAA